MKEKKCPRCGKTFICQHDTTCFCAKYTLLPEERLRIQQDYHDCLCEACLQQYAISRTPAEK